MHVILLITFLLNIDKRPLLKEAPSSSFFLLLRVFSIVFQLKFFIFNSLFFEKEVKANH